MLGPPASESPLFYINSGFNSGEMMRKRSNWPSGYIMEKPSIM